MAEKDVVIELTYEQRDLLVKKIEGLVFELEEEGCRVYDKDKIEELVRIIRSS